MWMSSRDLGFFYKLDAEGSKLSLKWIRRSGLGGSDHEWRDACDDRQRLNDDRYIYCYDHNSGFSKRFACPDLTGSYLSYDGESLISANGTNSGF